MTQSSEFLASGLLPLALRTRKVLPIKPHYLKQCIVFASSHYPRVLMRSLSSLLSVSCLLLSGMLCVSLPEAFCATSKISSADADEIEVSSASQYEFQLGNIGDIQVDPGRSNLINAPIYGGPFGEGHTSLSISTHVDPHSGIYGFMPMFMLMKFLYEGDCEVPIYANPQDRRMAFRIDITPQREHPNLTLPAAYQVILTGTGQTNDDLVWFEGESIFPHFGQTCREVPTGVLAASIREGGKNPALRIRPELEESGFTVTITFTSISQYAGPTTFVSMLSLEDPSAKPGHGSLLSHRYSAHANYTYHQGGQTLQSSVEMAEGIPTWTLGMYCTNSANCARRFPNSFLAN